MRTRFFSNFLCFCVLFVFVGCTQPISDETSKKLDTVTRFAASALGAPAAVQLAALRQADENRRLCDYLSTGTVNLGRPPAKPNVSALASAQQTTGTLLLGYLEALEEASRGDSIAELAQARQGFVTSVGEFETAVSGSSNLSPVVEALGNLIARAGESRRQARIRGIMAETTDALEILSALVERDVAQAIRETQLAVNTWDEDAGCVLEAYSNRSDAIELYDEFDAQRREFSGQLIVIERGPATMNSLVDAHLLAGEETASFEQVLQQVISIAEETKALVDALEGV